MKLSAIQKEINKNQGDRALVKMSDDLVVDIPRIPTGVLAVDKILGGGFPKGKTIEVFGKESGGKTSLALRFAGQAQKLGNVVYIDLENALDPTIAANSGVNMNELFLSQPESSEDALEVVEACVGAEDVSAIVVDSVAGMTPAAEIRGDYGDSHVGLQARLMSQALRKLTTKMRVEGSDVTVVWINQLRCLPKTDPVVTSQGLKTMGALQVGDLVQGPHDWVPVKNISHQIVEGVELQVVGMGLRRMSNNHLQPIIRDGLYLEVLGSEIVAGDWLLIRDEASNITPLAERDGTSPERLLDAAILGAFFADGHAAISKSKHFKYIDITEKNPGRRILVRALLSAKFGKDFSNVKSALCRVGSAGYEFIMDSQIGTHGPVKTIPPVITMGSFAVIREFLRYASFDTHRFGKDDPNGFLWTFETPEQAQQFQALLGSVGIRANIKWAKDNNHGVGCWSHLAISGNDAVRYRDIIGFAEPEKQEKAQRFAATKDYARGRYDVVPRELGHKIFGESGTRPPGVKSCAHYSPLNTIYNTMGLNYSRQRLIEYADYTGNKMPEVDMIKTFRFAQVQDVNHAVRFEAVDIEVEGGLFIANGMLTHNSTINSMPGMPNTTTPGGRALKFYSSVRLEVTRTGQIKQGDEVIGHTVRVKTVKNRYFPPYKTAVFDIMYDSGISNASTLVDLAIESGFIDKGKAGWFTVLSTGEKVQGRPALLKALEADPATMEALEKELL